LIANPFDSKFVKLAARVGAELGADIIKTFYTGDATTFREVTESCPVPVVIAGGPKVDNVRQVLEVVRDALDAGAIGIAFGRNVWRHENPVAMVRALRRIIHEDASVDDVIEML